MVEQASEEAFPESTASAPLGGGGVPRAQLVGEVIVMCVGDAHQLFLFDALRQRAEALALAEHLRRLSPLARVPL